MTNHKHKCVGLIITDHSLSAVEVSISKNGPSVSNYSKILLEEGIIAHGCVILNKESFQEAVKKVLSSGIGGHIKTKEVLVSLPEERIFSHQVTIPKDKIGDTKFIKEAAKDFIPIELEKAIFDYKIVSESRDKKGYILSFAAAQRNVVESTIKYLKEVKLEVTNMNIDIHCLIRSFHNSLNKSEGDFLLINLNTDRDIFAVNSTKTGITKIIQRAKKEEVIDKIKALENLATTVEVQNLLIALKKGEGLNEAQKAGLKASLAPYLKNLEQKIRQVVSAADAHEPIEIHTIYLTGLLAALPGVEELVTNMLPGIEIKKSVQYTEIPAEIEEDALQGIGLCIADSLPNDKGAINLLPESKKDEITLGRISPKLKALSMILTFLLIIFSGQMSIKTTKNYLNSRITAQEVSMYNDKALNPYKNQLAKSKQQILQKNQQILSLLDDAIPVNQLIEEIDEYNKNGLSLVSITYSDSYSGNTADMSIRARASDRSETEEFIEKLNNDPIYTKVDSPLSNLLGKGERFISVGLAVDKKQLLEKTSQTEEIKNEDNNDTITNEEESDV